MRIELETSRKNKRALISLVVLTENETDTERFFSPHEICWFNINLELTRCEGSIHMLLDPYVEKNYVFRVKFSRGNGFPKVYRADLKKKVDYESELVNK